MKVELQQALAYMLANLRKWEREEKQSTIVNQKWSRSDPETTYVQA